MGLRHVRIFIFCLIGLSYICGAQALIAGPGCGPKRNCGDMDTCAEAHHYLTQCGRTGLDRDHDGIPCEKMCGKTLATMRKRMEAQPFELPEQALGFLDLPSTETLTCGSKRTCPEMDTCAEAMHYLNACGLSSLDIDQDGTPCEGLCR